MPPSKTNPRVYLNSDDLLVRFMSLPERQQESTLAIFAQAIDDAETSVIESQRLIASARYGHKPTLRPVEQPIVN
jgi:hypothetical protein